MSRKARLLELLRSREKVKRSRALLQSKQLNEEYSKCDAITAQLTTLTTEKSLENSTCLGSQFLRDRYLVMKLMEQKDILENRKEFLGAELEISNRVVAQTQNKIKKLEDKSIAEMKHTRETRLMQAADAEILSKKI